MKRSSEYHSGAFVALVSVAKLPRIPQYRLERVGVLQAAVLRTIVAYEGALKPPQW